MIVLHELGHYIAAKKSGMKVTEFFLGFGPRLWSIQRGETEYGVKAIPAGAYVRIIGMHNLDEVPPEDEPRTYRQQSYPKRMAVATAGSAMHFLQAIVAVFLVFAVFGAPGGHLFTQANDFRIQSTVDGSAAQQAGIQPGDGIVAIDGEKIDSFTKLHDVVVPRQGKEVQIVISRDGQQITKDITIGESQGHGFLGVEPQAPPSQRLGPVTAAGRTFTELGYISKQTFGFFGSFFSPSGLSDFANTVVNRGETATTSDNQSGSSTAPSSGCVADRREPTGFDHRRGPLRQRDRRRGCVRVPRILRQHQHRHRNLQPDPVAAARRWARGDRDLRATALTQGQAVPRGCHEAHAARVRSRDGAGGDRRHDDLPRHRQPDPLELRRV